VNMVIRDATLSDRERRTGSTLVQAALVAARERGEIAVILLGNPAFYPRFGVVAGAVFGLRNPFTGVQEDGFVVAEEDFHGCAIGGSRPLAGGCSTVASVVRAAG
jgi:predicted N-acetyltransferase YhbS